MATAKMRGLVAVSIRQRESSPWRKEGKEVLAGQYLCVVFISEFIIKMGGVNTKD